MPLDESVLLDLRREQAMGHAERHPDTRIDVSAQLISLEPGLYTVSVAAERVIRTEGGMVLPCVRLDPLPRGGGERAFVSSLSETALMAPAAPPTYLRVAGARASVLLTIYKTTGPMPPPEIHISVVDRPAPPRAEPAAEPQDAVGSEAMDVLVHIQNHGDLSFPAGVWAAAARGRDAIEGFAITPGPDLPRGCLEYQAVLGPDWSSPWMDEGEFCGSRQMALPLLGVRVRLRGGAAESHRCRVWGRFGDDERGPCDDGAVCEADGAPLTGLRIAVTKRPARGADAPAAARPRARRGRD